MLGRIGMVAAGRKAAREQVLKKSKLDCSLKLLSTTSSSSVVFSSPDPDVMRQQHFRRTVHKEEKEIGLIRAAGVANLGNVAANCRLEVEDNLKLSKPREEEEQQQQVQKQLQQQQQNERDEQQEQVRLVQIGIYDHVPVLNISCNGEHRGEPMGFVSQFFRLLADHKLNVELVSTAVSSCSVTFKENSCFQSLGQVFEKLKSQNIQYFYDSNCSMIRFSTDANANLGTSRSEFESQLLNLLALKGVPSNMIVSDQQNCCISILVPKSELQDTLDLLGLKGIEINQN